MSEPVTVPPGSATPHTATIIPFPVRRPAAADAAADQMAAASTEQRAALREWQDALNELTSSLHGLGSSLRSLEQALSISR